MGTRPGTRPPTVGGAEWHCCIEGNRLPPCPVIRSRRAEDRAVTVHFTALHDGNLSPSDVSERAAKLNATVPFFEVAVRQTEPQEPAHRQHDDLGREPVPNETRIFPDRPVGWNGDASSPESRLTRTISQRNSATHFGARSAARAAGPRASVGVQEPSCQVQICSWNFTEALG